MVCAKNYEIMSTSVEVMQKKPWPLFFRTRCTFCKAPVKNHTRHNSQTNK